MTKTQLLLNQMPVNILESKAAARKAASLPLNVSQALVGQLLSDGSASRSSPTANTRLTWSFGHMFEGYANVIASIFSLYCNTGVYPVNVRAKVGGKTIQNYRLKTVTSPLFNYYYDIFYVFNQTKGKYSKVVPVMIMDLMSPITLAHLIMGDGNYDSGRNRVRIYTNSFSHEDCVRLAAAITNMGILTNVMKDKVGNDGTQQYILTIGAKQLDQLRAVVVPLPP